MPVSGHPISSSVRCGGPSIMEAANRDTRRQRSRSIRPQHRVCRLRRNRYMYPSLSFQFTIFALRKMQLLPRAHDTSRRFRDLRRNTDSDADWTGKMTIPIIAVRQTVPEPLSIRFQALIQRARCFTVRHARRAWDVIQATAPSFVIITQGQNLGLAR